MLSKSKSLSVLLFLCGLIVALPASARLPRTLIPEVTFTTAAGLHKSFGNYQHEKLLIWQVATWCGSCAAGLHVLDEHSAELEKAGLKVILLRMYQDGGYPGMSITQFVNRVAPSLLHQSNWVIGDASASFARTYNPKKYPDIYYLIDRNGVVVAINGAPSATYGLISKFMTGKE